MVTEETRTANAYVSMSFEEYDAFCAQADDVELFSKKAYWPSEEEINAFKEKLPLPQLTLFLDWLLQKNGEPKTALERQSKSAMHHFINHNLVLEEDV